MPPKAAQKSKATEPETPKSKTKQTATATATASTPTPTPTPKKKKGKEPPPPLKSIPQDTRAPIPIAATFEGDSVQSMLTKNGVQTHTLKLEAQLAFSLVKTVVLTEGEFEGHQAIILKPAKAFPFLKLSKEVRNRIYKLYFAPDGIIDKEIIMEGKRSANREVWAKSYSQGSANRVALLAVNKEINEEAAPVLYAHNLTFESTTTVLDFLSQVPAEVKTRLKDMTVNAFVKTSSRNALLNLATCPNLTRLHIDGGIAKTDDPARAAQSFYNEAYKFLEAAGAKKGDKASGLDVLSFGRSAFMTKDGEKSWGPTKRQEFMDSLKAKLV